MTLVQMRHLIALAETGSFRRAAELTFLTQPAFSRSIKALEDELGQRLFDRQGWRTDPTPFGESVLERARRLVQEAEHLKEDARRVQEGLTGTLRLGLGSGPGAILTQPLLRHMATQHPRAHLELARANTTLLVLALRERRLDALVVDARSLPPAPDLEVQAVTELRGAFLCRPGHPLTQRAAPLRFDDLLAYPFASTPLSDEIGRLLVERYGPQAHLEHCVTLRSEEIAALVAVAEVTDTVVLTTRPAAPALVELELQPPLQANARFALVTLAGRSEPPLLPLLKGLIVGRLKGEL
jgi:DNA-binding transcriptional LysR family regulator